MTTGELIRNARQKAGITQAELARKLGISYQSIGQWERNIRKPKPESLLKLAQALEISVSVLLGVTDEDGYMTGNHFADPSDFEFIKALGLDNPSRRTALLADPHSSNALIADRLKTAFDSLNPSGQQVAVERVEELTEIPKYQKDPPPEDSGNG